MKSKAISISKKKREQLNSRKNTVIKGSPLNYNAGFKAYYIKKVQSIIDPLMEYVEKSVIKFFNSDVSEDFFESQSIAMDEAISSQSRIFMNKLMNRVMPWLDKKSILFSTKMVKEAEKLSKSSLHSSLKKLTGAVTIKTSNISQNLKQIMKANVEENAALIKTIGENYLTNVEKAVYRSITTGKGLKDLVPEIQGFLKDQYKMHHNKAKNVALDQTRKVFTSINIQRMKEIGQKKFEWVHSGGGQHPREDHIAMNGKIYNIDNPPIIDKKTGVRGFPSQAINCFVGSTEISLANGCVDLWRHFYSGDIINIILSGGHVFQCTPNHPILTLRGWLPANEIKESDYLIGDNFNNDFAVSNKVTRDKVTFKDTFNSLHITFNAKRLLSSDFNFHGYIPVTDVDAISPNNILPHWIESMSEKQIEKFVLALSDIITNDFIPSFNSKVFKPGFPSHFGKFFSFVGGKFRHSDFSSLAAIPNQDAELFNDIQYGTSTNIVPLGNTKNAFTFFITCDDVSFIRVYIVDFPSDRNFVPDEFIKSLREPSRAATMFSCEFPNRFSSFKNLFRVSQKIKSVFSGHVYTMQSYNGWYSVSSANIISKNCKCIMLPVIEYNND